MDLSSLLHLGGDYRNHKMILIDTFLPGFSLLGDNIDPRGVIWDTQETAETERERGASAKIQDLMLLPNVDTWIGCWIFIYLLLRLRPFFFCSFGFCFCQFCKRICSQKQLLRPTNTQTSLWQSTRAKNSGEGWDDQACWQTNSKNIFSWK